MKMIIIITATLLGIFTTAYAGDLTGIIYQNTKEHLAGSDASITEKTGKASCIQFFGIVAKGNCTIYNAMRN